MGVPLVIIRFGCGLPLAIGHPAIGVALFLETPMCSFSFYHALHCNVIMHKAILGSFQRNASNQMIANGSPMAAMVSSWSPFEREVPHTAYLSSSNPILNHPCSSIKSSYSVHQCFVAAGSLLYWYGSKGFKTLVPWCSSPNWFFWTIVSRSTHHSMTWTIPFLRCESFTRHGTKLKTGISQSKPIKSTFSHCSNPHFGLLKSHVYLLRTFSLGLKSVVSVFGIPKIWDFLNLKIWIHSCFHIIDIYTII